MPVLFGVAAANRRRAAGAGWQPGQASVGYQGGGAGIYGTNAPPTPQDTGLIGYWARNGDPDFDRNSMSVHSGGLSNNTTYNDLIIEGSHTVSNVTFNRCWFRAPGAEHIQSSGGVVFNDCDFWDPPDADGWPNVTTSRAAATFGNYEMYRCWVSSGPDALKVSNTVRIEDSYLQCHKLVSDSHSDVMQINDESATASLIVRRTFIHIDGETAFDGQLQKNHAGLQCGNKPEQTRMQFNPPATHEFAGCYFRGGGVWVNYRLPPEGEVLVCIITNNVSERGTGDGSQAFVANPFTSGGSDFYIDFSDPKHTIGGEQGNHDVTTGTVINGLPA